MSLVPQGEGFGLQAKGQGRAQAEQPRPIEVERWDGQTAQREAWSYQEVRRDAEALVASARVPLGEGASLQVEDRLTVEGAVLRVERSTRVLGNAPGGYATAFRLRLAAPLAWPDVDPFVPGNIYGWGLQTPAGAFGSVSGYLGGVRQVSIREDRLPAPLFGLHLRDGSSLTVLNPRPDGSTTPEDSRDLRGTPLVDARYRVAALGGEEAGGHLSLGGQFPGSEGEITYLADTPFDDGTFGGNRLRNWRRRFHPVQDGLETHFELHFRFGQGERYQDLLREAWRWAWDTLDPALVPQDLEAARAALAEVLEASVMEVDGRAGPVHAVDAVSGRPLHLHAGMGFTARATDSGLLLLRLPGSPERRRQALAVLDTFAALPAAPPQAEGFMLDTGEITSGVRDRFYLRSLCEGGKGLLRAYVLERGRGHEHPAWLGWCRAYADWLLAQEQPGGGFPRAWRDHSAEVYDAELRSSCTAIPFLLELAQATGEARYRDAATRAGEVCWALGQSQGVFVGGTIDNPNVADKEAGALPLEAYLALYEATGEARWLTRAREAADYTETWIYLWNVPMLPGEDSHYKAGVTTAGVQLIASGHSLTDAYMAWDVARYARLARHTGDAHYLAVARLLLHNTKAMLALPEHPYDLKALGWQQEHWSFAPPRGSGVHRLWLPWVAVSQLEGLLDLEAQEPELYRAWAGGAQGAEST